MTTHALKDLLRDRTLKVSGTKQELIQVSVCGLLSRPSVSSSA